MTGEGEEEYSVQTTREAGALWRVLIGDGRDADEQRTPFQ
jgi:hypothetical protein